MRSPTPVRHRDLASILRSPTQPASSSSSSSNYYDRSIFIIFCHVCLTLRHNYNNLLISGINFHFHLVNQFHLFMLISTHPSLLHFLHPSPLHSFTLNSKLTFLVNPFRHRSSSSYFCIKTADKRN